MDGEYAAVAVMQELVRRTERPTVGVPAGNPVPAAPRRLTGLLTASALIGAAATTYLGIAGTALGMRLPMDHLWFWSSGAFAPDRIGTHHAAVYEYTALAALCAAWLLAGLAVRRGTSVRSLLLLVLAWGVPLLVAAPLFSPDVYLYTAVGAATDLGVNPYLHGPAAAGSTLAIRGVEPFWASTPSPYSPPFVVLTAQLSHLFDGHMLRVLLAFRVLCVAAWASLAFSVPRLAARCGQSAQRGLWLAVLNPLVLVNAVSANHNDVLMMALVVPGLLLALDGRTLPGVLLCTAGAGVKVVALAAVVAIGVHHAWQQGTRREQLRALLVTGGVSGAAFAVVCQVSGYGWGWLSTLSTPGRALEPLSPLTAIAVTIDRHHPPLGTVRAAGLLVGVLICAALLTRLRSWGLVRVTAWMFLTIVAVGPVVWEWYLMWPVMLLAAAGRPRERRFFAVFSMLLLGTTLPGGQSTLGLLPRPLIDVAVLVGLVAVAVGYGWPALAAARRRGGRVLRAVEPVALLPADGGAQPAVAA